jgi:polysaccharide export outer membrane protein
MSNFWAIGFVAILLLGGCANSYNDQFQTIETSDAHQDATIPTAADVTKAEAEILREDQPSGDASLSSQAERLQGAEARETTATGIPGRDMPAKGTYRIGSQDVIEITVFKVAELSKAVQVSEAGTVNLPLVGEVVVAGKTGREVEKNLTELLQANYLQNPQVSVFIREYNSEKITIEGAVKRAGVFPLQGGMSLLQAVATAQGLDDMSDDSVVVFRNVAGRRQAARFDISDIRDGSAADPQLTGGDVIVAGTSMIKKSLNGFMKILPIAGLFAFL